MAVIIAGRSRENISKTYDIAKDRNKKYLWMYHEEATRLYEQAVERNNEFLVIPALYNLLESMQGLSTIENNRVISGLNRIEFLLEDILKELKEGCENG